MCVYYCMTMQNLVCVYCCMFMHYKAVRLVCVYYCTVMP